MGCHSTPSVGPVDDSATSSDVTLYRLTQLVFFRVFVTALEF